MNVARSVPANFGSWVKEKIQSQDHYSKFVNFSLMETTRSKLYLEDFFQWRLNLS